MSSLEVTFFGTRGTLPVSGSQVAKFGGSTTCLQIQSPCLAPDSCLVVDAGNGLIPLTQEALAAGVKEVHFLFTHWHWDHTIGFPIAAFVHMKHLPMNLWGPINNPADIIRDIMKPPLFPVAYAEVSSHLRCKAIDHPPGKIFALHPRGGMKLFRLDELEAAELEPQGQLVFDGGSRHHVNECLIIRMQKTHHPDYTVSYRFEERPTGKVFVFATDHEDQCETPVALRNHFKGADLLVADCQYTEERYKTRAGYGHGTPRHCVKMAREAGVLRLGLTHHDPMSTDKDVEEIERAAMQEAETQGFSGEVFACADGMRVII